jgi:hypothetical protein
VLLEENVKRYSRAKTERIEAWKSLYESGLTYDKIGIKYGVTRQRVHQTLSGLVNKRQPKRLKQAKLQVQRSRLGAFTHFHRCLVRWLREIGCFSCFGCRAIYDLALRSGPKNICHQCNSKNVQRHRKNKLVMNASC